MGSHSHLPHPETKPRSPALQADCLPSELAGSGSHGGLERRPAPRVGFQRKVRGSRRLGMPRPGDHKQEMQAVLIPPHTPHTHTSVLQPDVHTSPLLTHPRTHECVTVLTCMPHPSSHPHTRTQVCYSLDVHASPLLKPHTHTRVCYSADVHTSPLLTPQYAHKCVTALTCTPHPSSHPHTRTRVCYSPDVHTSPLLTPSPPTQVCYSADVHSSFLRGGE